MIDQRTFGQDQSSIFQGLSECDQQKLTSRAALRVLSAVTVANKDVFERSCLLAFQSVLIACCNSQTEKETIDGLIVLTHPVIATLRDGSPKDRQAAFAVTSAMVCSSRGNFGDRAIAIDNSLSAVVPADFFVAGDTWRTRSEGTRTKAGRSSDTVDSGRNEQEFLWHEVNADRTSLLAGLPAKALWSSNEIPPSITEKFRILSEKLQADARWRFFHDWYLGMWEGTWEDWDLAHAVASIPAEVWKAGLTEVAEAIEKIKKRLGRDLPRPENVPELEKKNLREHVKKLLASPEMTALTAEGAAETLERAIKTYLDEAPANCLPDDLSHLHDLPALFRRISKTVKSEALAHVKEQKLAEEIEALNAKVADLEAKLKAARARTVDGIFAKGALAAAGAAFGVEVMSSISLTFGHFFAEFPTDIALENLRGWLLQLESAEPKPEPPSLPPAMDT